MRDVPPKVFMIQWKKNDWVKDFLTTAKNQINHDPQTRGKLELHIIDDLNDVEEHTFLDASFQEPNFTERQFEPNPDHAGTESEVFRSSIVNKFPNLREYLPKLLLECEITSALDEYAAYMNEIDSNNYIK